MFEFLEWLFFCVILFFQIKFFISTGRGISKFKNLIPSKLAIYHGDNNSPSITFNSNEKKSVEATSIVNSINGYLKNNKAAAADFNLVRDIVERNSDAIEEDISQTLNLPLYLGLMGTMLGIVVGLWGLRDLSDLFNETKMGDSINVLLGGVRVAMIASFTGLLFMVFNTLNYKGAKTEVDKRKNDFYTLIQTDLLPVLQKNIHSSLYDIQTGFSGFTDQFKIQIDTLAKIIGSNSDALIAQQNIFSDLKEIDIAAFANANVKVLQELRVTTEKLGMFNSYINNLNEFVTNSKGLIDRTDNLSQIATNLNTNFDASRQLFTFLNNHFTRLEESKNILEHSISEVDNRLSKTFDEFANHLQEKIKRIETITIEEEKLMVKALSENRTNLGKLSLLEDLNRQVTELKTSSNTQSIEYQYEVKQLNETIIRIEKIIEKVVNKKKFWGIIDTWLSNEGIKVK